MSTKNTTTNQMNTNKAFYTDKDIIEISNKERDKWFKIQAVKKNNDSENKYYNIEIKTGDEYKPLIRKISKFEMTYNLYNNTFKGKPSGALIIKKEVEDQKDDSYIVDKLISDGVIKKVENRMKASKNNGNIQYDRKRDDFVDSGDEKKDRIDLENPIVFYKVRCDHKNDQVWCKINKIVKRENKPNKSEVLNDISIKDLKKELKTGCKCAGLIKYQLCINKYGAFLTASFITLYFEPASLKPKKEEIIEEQYDKQNNTEATALAQYMPDDFD